MGIAGIEINVILMVLNLLPLPPLDGGRMAVSLLPHRLAYQFSRIEPYGFMILLVLLFSGVLGAVIGPMITWVKVMIVSIFGLYI
jgi:Zn-dependent protease